jgi:hypothetical protein
MQKLANGIFWDTKGSGSESNGFKPTFLDPAVNRFRVNACPFRYFEHGQQVAGIPGARR